MPRAFILTYTKDKRNASREEELLARQADRDHLWTINKAL